MPVALSPKKSPTTLDKLFYFFLGLAILIMVLSLTLTWVSRPKGLQTPDASNTSVPSNVANLDIMTPLGRRFPLAPLTGGVVLVVSADCPHCHEMLKMLKPKADSLTHLTILCLEGAKRGQNLLDSLGLKVPVVGPGLPPDKFADKLGITRTPTFFFITATGQVKFYEIGVTDQTLPGWLELMR